MIKILSTKFVDEDIKNICIENNFNLVEYNALQVVFLNPPNVTNTLSNCNHLIFTSNNAVKFFMDYCIKNKINFSNFSVSCIKGKSSSLLKNYEFKSYNVHQNAKELSDNVVKKFSKNTFCFFCGEYHLPIIHETLNQHNILLHKLVVYKTVFCEDVVDNYDAYWFYSPRNVQSFFTKNSIPQSALCVAIGKTTAKELALFTKNKILWGKENSPMEMYQITNKYFNGC